MGQRGAGWTAVPTIPASPRVDSVRATLPPVVIRPARRNDVSKLSAFFIEAWKEAGPSALGFTGATDEAIAAISSEEFLTRRLATPTIHMTVAEEGRSIIGFASVKRVGPREAELSAIVVLESATGRGVGTRLLRKAIDAARKRGFTSILVKTEVKNERAIRFYRNNGFTESGKALEKIGASKVSLRLMERRLR